MSLTSFSEKAKDVQEKNEDLVGELSYFVKNLVFPDRFCTVRRRLHMPIIIMIRDRISRKSP